MNVVFSGVSGFPSWRKSIVHIHDGFAFIGDMRAACIGVCADDCGFDAAFGEMGDEFIDIFRGNGHGHAFLDSLIQISHGAMPGYLSGTFSSSTWKPPDCSAISPMEELMPPAPLSVMAEYQPLSRISLMMASDIFFCVIGSPI